FSRHHCASALRKRIGSLSGLGNPSGKDIAGLRNKKAAEWATPKHDDVGRGLSSLRLRDYFSRLAIDEIAADVPVTAWHVRTFRGLRVEAGYPNLDLVAPRFPVIPDLIGELLGVRLYGPIEARAWFCGSHVFIPLFGVGAGAKQKAPRKARPE